MIKYIVGFDGGELSMRAAELAANKLLARGGGELVLVYVIDWSEFEIVSVEALAIRHTQQMEQLESAEEDIIKPALEKLKRDGVTISSKIQVGSPAELISAYADELGAEQIFVGHKSKGLLAKLGLGSVAYAILQKAKVPVTVVP